MAQRKLANLAQQMGRRALDDDVGARQAQGAATPGQAS
jgi:hypothetical protein